jgi:Mrp family chromosome partitioning ATPase
VAAADPVSKPAEAYRMLGVNLAPKINGLTRILVTSPGSAEGKSVTAANLAVSFVEAGYRVGIVSVDFRRPRLHRYFAVRESPGLAEGLTGAVPTGRAVVQLSTNLVLVPSGNGSRHPHQLLREARFVSFLDKLSSFLSRNGKDGSRDGRSGRPALVILDAPAVLEAAEVSSLASLVDGIVLAIRGGRTTRDAAREAAEQIRKSGGNLLGCVLVDADPSAANGDRPSVFGNGLNGQGLNGRGAAAQAQSEVLEQAR